MYCLLSFLPRGVAFLLTGHHLIQERPADLEHNIGMETKAAAGSSTPGLFTWLYPQMLKCCFFTVTLIPVGIAKYMREKTREKERREAKVYLLSCCCCWYFNVLQLFSEHSFSRKSPWQPSSWIFFHKSVFHLGHKPVSRCCNIEFVLCCSAVAG